MDLTTVVRVKKVISQAAETPSLGSVDLEVQALVTAVSSMAEAYMGRVALAAAQTEYFDVEPGRRLFRLRAFPVTTLTSIHFDPDQAWGADTLLAATEYASPVFSPIGALALRRDLVEPDGDREPAALRVVYTGGMAASTAAFIVAFPDIAAALDVQIASAYHNRNALGMASALLPGGGSMAPLPDFWIAPVRAVLDRHRRVA